MEMHDNDDDDDDDGDDDDNEEEEEDDKWAKQEMSEDTTMVAVDQITSLITSMESPTPTSLISVISSPTRHNTKRAKLNSLQALPYPPRATKAPVH